MNSIGLKRQRTKSTPAMYDDNFDLFYRFNQTAIRGSLQLGSLTHKGYPKKLDTRFDFSSFITKIPNKILSAKSDPNIGIEKAVPRRRNQSMHDSHPEKSRREFQSMIKNRSVTPERLEKLKNMSANTLEHLGSTTLFQPDRYFKTRGLSIRFDKSTPLVRKSGVYVSPMLIHNTGGDDNLVDIYTKQEQKFLEKNIE
jgi:hypothetical protein